ncbi:MAG: UvrD-helicase domain-containing protein [Tannerella sp.]|jgi:ATP-dependent exoDNAse (exonuclease V) beta subunit|nr:UvrD-helicase domain-containing protein [Tannerella sp.]
MLTLYSASAGTGKTHTLTGEYLSLLFKGREQYRHILAVTFTNKATAEMKGRIVDELFRLANHHSSAYMEQLSDNGRRSEAEIRSRAKRILIAILHDYSAFNISTIDHFFQHTIRAFTREIGLQGNYKIELDESQMMDEAVDNMLSELEKNENAALMDWLLRFTEDKIEEGDGWDIRKDIIKLGGQLFKETYKSHSDEARKELNQKDFLSGYRNELYRIIQSVRKTVKESGEKGLLLMQRYGMQPSDFKGGSRSVFLHFEKWAAGEIKEPTATFCNLVDNPDEYSAKTATPAQKQAAAQVYADGMNELIRGIVSFFENLTPYYTACEIARNFYALGILSDLSQHIAAWREENNKMLIADTTELLHKVIDNSEIPFIYEKTGTRIEHYMIDEFQDTSGMQWSNFRPLLKDSLDSGRRNLIVGDVKQSIYRFRNSDWTLLDRKVKEDFSQQVDEKKLDVNRRSCRQIVEFNNILFNAIPVVLQQAYNDEINRSSLPEKDRNEYNTRIVSAYKDASQHVSKPFAGKDGHVRVQFLAGAEDKTWQDLSLEQLPGIVEQLQDNGYELRDIAILTRTGKEGLQAAETLLAYKEAHPKSGYKYDIISEDSLTIRSSLSVRWLVSMLRYLNQPDNTSNYCMALLSYTILRRKNRQMASPASEQFPEQAPGTITDNDLFRPFPVETMKTLRKLANRPLYELAEGLFRLFEKDFPENELVFIQAFLDTVAEYALNETADTGQFIAWWNETGYRKKIVTPDSQNAIRIMTIHKAKGLGFKVVIIPFAEWKIDQKDAIIWCRTEQNPFDKLSLIPVKYGSVLKNTFFAPDYFHEKLHAYMDNLNTLYVAFTRAKEELIVMAPQPKTETLTLSRLLWEGLQTDTQHPFDAENGMYERGMWWQATTDHTPPDTEELPVKRFHSVSPDRRMQLRLHRKGSLLNDEKRKYGILMHDILSRIEKRDDIPASVSEKYTSGEITRDEYHVLEEKLTALTGKEEVKHWFDGSMQVINEAEILSGEGISQRPDRIMIHENGHVVVVDYKSGEHKEVRHHRQIKKYMSLIREMGYPDIEGYLWYITLNEIEKCIF